MKPGEKLTTLERAVIDAALADDADALTEATNELRVHRSQRHAVHNAQADALRRVLIELKESGADDPDALYDPAEIRNMIRKVAQKLEVNL